MNSQDIIIILFGILTFFLLVALFFVNRVLLIKQKADIQYENVKKYIDERIMLFERMYNFVEENIEEEQKLAAELKEANERLSDVLKTNVYDLKELKRTKKLFAKFVKLGSIYPHLNKNQIYKLISDETEINVERIEYSIDSYDKIAKEYNEFKKTKLNSFISKMLKLSDYDYYNK